MATLPRAYEAAVQREMLMARKVSGMRGLLDTALDMLAVIARPLPKDAQVRHVLVAEIAAMRSAANAIQARYPETSCSQCGKTFGPGDHGFSHCDNHAHLVGRS